MNTTKGEDPMTTTATAALTREEAAYLYLADFPKGTEVIISDSLLGRRSGTVAIPQRGGLADAYLTVQMDGSGDEIWVDVAGLMAGEYRIERDDRGALEPAADADRIIARMRRRAGEGDDLFPEEG